MSQNSAQQIQEDKEEIDNGSIMGQIENIKENIKREKAKIERLTLDKTEIDKANAFFVNQNPNTPMGPKCLKIIDKIEIIIKNQNDKISKLENMLLNLIGQTKYEESCVLVDNMARRYDV